MRSRRSPLRRVLGPRPARIALLLVASFGLGYAIGAWPWGGAWERAAETMETVLGVLATFFARNWRWVTALLLIAGLAAAILSYRREESWKSARIPGFLLVSLGIHFLLGFGLLYISFGDTIAEEARPPVREIVVAMHLAQLAPLVVSGPEEDVYNRMTDTKPLEIPAQNAVVRGENEPMKPPPPTVPATLDHDLRDHELASPPAKLAEAEKSALLRHRLQANLPAEDVEVEVPQASVPTPVEQVEPARVEIESAGLSAVPDPLPPEPSLGRIALPDQPQETRSPSLDRHTLEAKANELVEMQEPGPTSPAPTERVERTQVDLDRTEASAIPAPFQPDPAMRRIAVLPEKPQATRSPLLARRKVETAASETVEMQEPGPSSQTPTERIQRVRVDLEHNVAAEPAPPIPRLPELTRLGENGNGPAEQALLAESMVRGSAGTPGSAGASPSRTPDGNGSGIATGSVGLPSGLPPRRAAKSPLGKYAEENIGLQAMFQRRQGDVKNNAVTEFGGNPQSQSAVRLGLVWLSKHQHSDGYWSLNRFYKEEHGQAISGRGYVDSDTAATAFALLPFLGSGHTHRLGEYQPVVQKGLEWLMKRQKPDGELNPRGGSNPRMYAHAIATIALCEAYGMSRDPSLRDPAQRAVGFIVRAQTRGMGGWRYQPNQDSDTSVVGWQLMALKSGQMAGLTVPQETFELVRKWLDSVEGRGNDTGRFRYQPGRAIAPAMTAEALLCLQYLRVDHNHPHLQAGAKYLLAHLPKKGQETSYYWYYGTQVMFHMQGDGWQQWNVALRDMLVKSQRTEGPVAGTWDPTDEWERQAGRLYATALRLLMLEVYYRHLPLYQTLQGS